MKIRHILASSPKFGTEEHVRNDVGNTLVATGFAEVVPPIRRGEKGWLEERNAMAAMVTAPSQYDTPAGKPGISWGILRVKNGANVIREVNGEKFFFDTPPADTPASIRQQWLDAVNVISPEAAQYAKETAIQKHLLQQQQEKHSVFVAVGSAKPR